ncbi:MAG: KAP family NTPase [Devosiaceae bacterium]|nr:KAP family NTPase [Devosiaceae bacterium]
MSEIWHDDLLGRRSDAEFLSKFLLSRIKERQEQGRKASYVLNVNAAWGRGKTFFLTNLAKQLKEQGYLVAEINAWQDDHADDPFLSVMSAINKTISPLVDSENKVWKNLKNNAGSIALAVVKGAGKQVAKKLIGGGMDEISSLAEGEDSERLPNQTAVSAIKGAGEGATKEVNRLIDKAGENLLSNFEQSRKSINDFQQNLEELLSEEKLKDKQTPLFILLDELDRCRPTYAIAMLERVKHLFDVNNIIFIIATDTEQLQHSIKAVYGQGFDSASYLNRFFDRSYEIKSPNIKNFVAYQIKLRAIDKAKLSIPPNTDLTAFLSDAFSYFEYELRDIEQFFEILGNIITVWDKKIEIEMSVMVFYIYNFQKKLFLQPSELAEYLNKRNTGLSWKIKVTNYPSNFIKRENANALDVFSSFLSMIEKTLDEINEITTSNDIQQFWCANRLSKEYAKEHQSGLNYPHPPFSIIKDYPEMISTAGRLVSIKDEE